MESARETAMDSGRGFEGGEMEPSKELRRILGGGETEPSYGVKRAGSTLCARVWVWAWVRVGLFVARAGFSGELGGLCGLCRLCGTCCSGRSAFRMLV